MTGLVTATGTLQGPEEPVPFRGFRPGQFFLVRSTGWEADGICAATHGRYNHAGPIISTEGDTIEMRPGGAAGWRGAAVRGKVPAHALIVDPPLTDDQRAKAPSVAEAFLTKDDGEPVSYNWLGLAALGAAQNGMLWVPGVKAKLSDTDDLFCSQEVDLWLHLLGLQVFTDDRAFGNVSPEDLDDISVQRNWYRYFLGLKPDVRIWRSMAKRHAAPLPSLG